MALSHPEEYPRRQEALKHYLLYNQGHGTEAAIAKIEELLAKRINPSVRRPKYSCFSIRNFCRAVDR